MNILRNMCLDLFIFLRIFSAGRKRLRLRGSLIFSLETTFKEREHIEDMIQSIFHNLDHIDPEGVNHVVVES